MINEVGLAENEVGFLAKKLTLYKKNLCQRQEKFKLGEENSNSLSLTSSFSYHISSRAPGTVQQ